MSKFAEETYLNVYDSDKKLLFFMVTGYALMLEGQTRYYNDRDELTKVVDTPTITVVDLLKKENE